MLILQAIGGGRRLLGRSREQLATNKEGQDQPTVGVLHPPTGCQDSATVHLPWSIGYPLWLGRRPWCPDTSRHGPKSTFGTRGM